MKKICVYMATVVLALSLSGRAQSPATGNVENGKHLFLKIGCYQCHGYAGQGGIAGPRIASTVMNAEAFEKYIRRPTGAMPAYVEKVLTSKDTDDIYSYAKSLPAPKLAKDIPLLNQLKNR